MTVENAYQLVREHNPNMPFTMFLNKLNRLVQAFIQETDCVMVSVKGTVTSTSDDITITSPASQTLSNIGTGMQMIYAFPTYLYNVHDIRFANDLGEYIDSPVSFRIDANYIEFFDRSGDPLSEWGTQIAYIEFYGTKAPAASTAATDTIPIPDQFCDALVARIVADEYAKHPETLPLAGYHRNEYQRLRIEAKRYGMLQRDRTSGRGYIGELMARDGSSSLFPDGESDVTLDGGTF